MSTLGKFTLILSIFLGAMEELQADAAKPCVSPLSHMLNQFLGAHISGATPGEQNIILLKEMLGLAKDTRVNSDRHLSLTPLSPNEWLLVQGDRFVDADQNILAVDTENKIRKIRLEGGPSEPRLEKTDSEFTLVLPSERILTHEDLKPLLEQGLSNQLKIFRQNKTGEKRIVKTKEERIIEINTFVKEKNSNPSSTSENAAERSLARWFQNHSQRNPDDWYNIFPEEDHLLLQTLGIIGYRHKAFIKELDNIIKDTGAFPALSPPDANGKPQTEFQKWADEFIKYRGKATLILLLSPESQEILKSSPKMQITAKRIREINSFVSEKMRSPGRYSQDALESSLARWFQHYSQRNPDDWYKIFPEEDHLLLQTLGIIGYKHKSRIKELDGLVKEAEDFPVLAPKHLPQTEFQKWASQFITYYGKNTLFKLLSAESQEILKSASKRKTTEQRIREINTFVKRKSRNPSQYSQDAFEKNLAIWFQNYSKMHPDDWYKIFPEEDHLLLQSLGIIGFGHKANIKKLDTIIRKKGKYRPLTSAGGKPRTEFQNWTKFFVEFYGKEPLIKLLSPESQKILLELNQGKRS